MFTLQTAITANDQTSWRRLGKERCRLFYRPHLSTVILPSPSHDHCGRRAVDRERVLRVSGGRIGFGAMQLATAGRDRETSVAVLRRAVELGVPLVDTAFLYGGGANEELVAEALYPYGEDVVVTTKVGVTGSGPLSNWRLDGRPESLRRQVDGSLRRLRVERIALLQLHRVDPEVPLADQVGALSELVGAGKAARIGLSEVSVGELAEARAIAGIASVQNRYNLDDRVHEPVLRVCEAEGIDFLPWRPLGEPNGEAIAIAAEVGATPAQVALAWLLDRSAAMLPIPGTSRVSHLEENVAAEQIELTSEQRRRLNQEPV
ncbi:aldo/keto reductase [Paractinoplanes bogorensis]|uniref:aldo/keto reductase n=1 Tax=Paractinoplanes bogorensis TaxID=1610840 RepID=UPI0027E01A05|nr:aldo/keto reductase [Actinoplanes bogorensis]